MKGKLFEPSEAAGPVVETDMSKKSAANALAEFFDDSIKELPNTYEWRIPQIEGFFAKGTNLYEQNRELKKFLSTQWRIANTPEKRMLITKTVVSRWGGVRRNKKLTLEEHIERARSNNPETPIKGVASYSKLLAIANPESYAIYDARVAACINAVQINRGATGLAFNYLPGRNNVVGNAGKKCGFSQCKRFSTAALKCAGWETIGRDETYSKYLELLKFCKENGTSATLTQMEMALFANAERECLKAMKLCFTSPCCSACHCKHHL